MENSRSHEYCKFKTSFIGSVGFCWHKQDDGNYIAATYQTDSDGNGTITRTYGQPITERKYFELHLAGNLQRELINRHISSNSNDMKM